MKRTGNLPHPIKSIAELHRLLEIEKPKHPLISVIDFSKISCYSNEKLKSVSYHFYCIALKKNFAGKMRYGQNYYDFDEGVMTFFSPNQIITTDFDPGLKLEGWWLVLHPDFIRGYPLAQRLNTYNFFSYAVNEALYVSESEEIVVDTIMQGIHKEYNTSIDGFSQDIIVSQIELLLNHCNRFYHRQFITRKTASNELLVKLETILADYFSSEKLQQSGLPTVQDIADQLHLSPNYLSDMLRTLTGQSTQQHIYDRLIEKAKEMLVSTNLSVGEIAFQFGFEYPQSFHKLFKRKTNFSPLEYRQSFN
ncbi:helix-turn-helix domain-containing protein [Rufibacter sediminis]|uniref:Helix-turn-helix transcriptional regulator n=1 Tax=Rufibacter sediminis TaxID=2762756 RepID=A0ABR6VPI5_9BACT|nr:helix-turn-helix transcriptional regulator [Rufibacter sediminis]MBC3539051.1 helix-turn-helix transcriptional regulator [Rufibacter sediminis]